MSSPVLLLILKSADGKTLLPVRAGFLHGETPESGPIADVGDFEQGNFSWDALNKILSLQLLTEQAPAPGAVTPTRIATGERRSDGLEVAGDLAQLLAVVKRVRRDAGGTQTRDGATEPAIDGDTPTTGMAALLAGALVLTEAGLVRLDGLVTSGGVPRSPMDRSAQDGGVPAAMDVLARLASWSVEGREHGFAMPLRIELPGAKAGAIKVDLGVGQFQVAQTTGETRFTDAGHPSAGVESGGPFPVHAVNQVTPVDFVIQQFKNGKLVGEGRRESALAPDPAITEARRLAFAEQASIMNALAGQQAATISGLQIVNEQVAAAIDAHLPPDAAALGRKAILGNDLDRINQSLAALGANVSGPLGGAGGSDLSPDAVAGATDITAKRGTAQPLVAYGTLVAYDEEHARAADPSDYEGMDPEKYAGIGKLRLAPRMVLDLDTLIGDRPRGGILGGGGRKKKKQPPPFPPPPGGGNPPPFPPPPPPPPPPGGDPQERQPFVDPAGSGDPAGGDVQLPLTDPPVGAEHDGITRIRGEDEDNADAGGGLRIASGDGPSFTFAGGGITGIGGHPTFAPGGPSSAPPPDPPKTPASDCPLLDPEAIGELVEDLADDAFSALTGGSFT